MKIAMTAAVLAAMTQSALAAGTYREDFSDGMANYWTPQQKASFKVVPSATGNLNYRGAAAADPTQTFAQVSTLSSRPLADFQYSVTVADNAVRPTFLIFRATPDFGSRYDATTFQTTYQGTGYAFGVACSPLIRSSFYFYKIVNGLQTTIQPWANAPLNCTGDIDHGDRLSVVAKGTQTMLYVNGTLVYTYTDGASIGSGRVGLYNYTDYVVDTFSNFDNIVISAPPAGAGFAPAVHPFATPGGEFFDASGRFVAR